MTRIEAEFKDKWYVPPKFTWGSELQYLRQKAMSIALVATLLSQNKYDFFSALEVIYLSENVYDEISDWKGEGCLYPEETYYDDICEELQIIPKDYDFKKISNKKINDQINFVLNLEKQRYDSKCSGYEYFERYKEEIKTKANAI